MFVPGTPSRPPQDLAIPFTEQLVFTVATQIPFAYVLYVAFRNLYRGDPTCLLFAIGGLIACAFEPIIDVLGFCFFPREGSWVAYEWHARPIPLFVPATYGWFVGGQGYWFLTILRDPATTKPDIWKLWLRAFVSNLILEYPAIFLGIYVYYGYQPLSLAGLPLWFLAIHAIAPMISAIIVYLLGNKLRGWTSLIIPAIVSSTYGMANAGFGWPVWVALSVDKGYHLTYPAAAVEFLLLACAIWIITTPFPSTTQSNSMKAR